MYKPWDVNVCYCSRGLVNICPYNLLKKNLYQNYFPLIFLNIYGNKIFKYNAEIYVQFHKHIREHRKQQLKCINDKMSTQHM